MSWMWAREYCLMSRRRWPEISKNISRELPAAVFEIEIFSGSFDSAPVLFRIKRFFWRFAQDDRAIALFFQQSVWSDR
jgi:hypothetical protein